MLESHICSLTANSIFQFFVGEAWGERRIIFCMFKEHQSYDLCLYVFFMFRWLGNDFPIKINFEICSKQLLTMRNRFLILPKAEKLSINEFLRFEGLKTGEKL